MALKAEIFAIFWHFRKNKNREKILFLKIAKIKTAKLCSLFFFRAFWVLFRSKGHYKITILNFHS